VLGSERGSIRLTPPPDAGDIDHVVRSLEVITEEAARAESRLGYFAALYLRMTKAVRQRTGDRGYFQDPARMQRLDVAFANHYFRALRGHLDGSYDVPRCWRVAFAACARPEPIILQHLYAGLSAHQLFDLAQAAAQTCSGQDLYELRGDYERVMGVVADLMIGVDHSVGQASPWIGLFDRIASRPWATNNRFAIRIARELAWSAAQDFARASSPAETQRIVVKLDRDATFMSELILEPNLLLRALVRTIRSRETKRVSENIEILRGSSG
jgi:hypothetical protein